MSEDADQAIAREVLAHYKAGVKSSLLAEYRCRARGAGCLLLHVWRAPGGLEFFLPRRRLSDGFAFARDVETGEFGWSFPHEAGRLHISDRELTRLPLVCNHISDTALDIEIWQDVRNRTPGKPRRVLLPRDTPGQV